MLTFLSLPTTPPYHISKNLTLWLWVPFGVTIYRLDIVSIYIVFHIAVLLPRRLSTRDLPTAVHVATCCSPWVLWLWTLDSQYRLSMCLAAVMCWSTPSHAYMNRVAWTDHAPFSVSTHPLTATPSPGYHGFRPWKSTVQQLDTGWLHGLPMYHLNLCNWLSLRRLVPWINHLPPVYRSTFWKSSLKW